MLQKSTVIEVLAICIKLCHERKSASLSHKNGIFAHSRFAPVPGKRKNNLTLKEVEEKENGENIYFTVVKITLSAALATSSCELPGDAGDVTELKVV